MTGTARREASEDGSSGRGRRLLSMLLVVAGVVLLAGAALVLVVGRAPGTITLAAGAPGGAYFAFGERLRDAVSEHGFALRLLETDGSVDNVRAIQAGLADIALVQSGTEEIADVSGLTAIAELFHEPVWIWYRLDRIARLETLSDLAGHTVGVGMPGSGTFAVARRLLDLEGVTVRAVEVNATATEAALMAGDLDAGFVVAAADAPIIATLAADPGLAVHVTGRTEAYARRLPYLSTVPVARAVLDLRRDVPPTDGAVLAARATLVGEPGIHPDVARLLVTVLPDVLDHPLLGDASAFPSLSMTRFPVNEDARRSLEEGPTPLESVLPFWIASPLARYYVIILPLLVLIFPAWQVTKAVYGWAMSSRIVNWYPRLHAIERGLPESTLPQLRLQRRFLRAVVDRMTARTRVSAGYMSAYYDLRGHIEWVQAKVEARIAELEALEPSGALDTEAEQDAAGTAEAAPLDPERFSDEAMGIDDDLRELREAAGRSKGA